jgi:putative cell wall-binding protein
MKVIGLFKGILLSFLIILTVSNKAFADTEMYQSKEFSKGNHTISVGDWSIHVHNEEYLSTISFKKSNHIYYQDSIEMGYIAKIHMWQQQNTQYFLIEKRLNGTSTILTFNVLKSENSSSLKKIFSSKEYIKGSLKFNNETITVTFPFYDEKDSLATPSGFLSDTFQLSTEGEFKLIESNQQVNPEIIKQNANKFMSFLSKTTITGTNPSPNEINRLLTEKALEYNVPPEIVKAIAWQESRWQQFRTSDDPYGQWKKGDVVIGYDGLGIGIMQISDPNLDSETKYKLMTDIKFNIDYGIRILKEKWNYSFSKDSSGNILIPKINDMNPEVLENWYFAIMAYNGISKVNDPTLTNRLSTWPPEPYQETIYKHIRTYGLLNITPFPTNILNGDLYYKSNSTNPRIMFKKDSYTINGPFHKSHHKFQKDDITIVTTDNVNLRKSVGGEVVRKLQEGEILQIAGNFLYENNRYNHFVWYPVKQLNDSKIYYIASSYIKLLNVNDLKVDLAGHDRYATSASISNYGWTQQVDTLILARGDLSIDALTGSVLAKKFNAPLLLVQNSNIPFSVYNEIKRLKPSTIYILGGEAAISNSVAKKLNESFPTKVFRIYGSDRYGTAVKVAQNIENVSTLFIATGNESSPDALAIGPVAAKWQAPILLSSNKGLTKSSIEYIKNKKWNKIYIVGSQSAVPSIVENQLLNLGIKKEQIERIAGNDRYQTSVEIAKRFNFTQQNAIFANGKSFIDALPGTPFAALIDAPILLIEAEKVPYVVQKWVSSLDWNSPKFYFLGGSTVITESTRYSLFKTLLENY